MNKSFDAHYFKLSASQGFANAQFHSGFCVLRDSGVPMDKEYALHCFKFSEEQGFTRGQYFYALCLLAGIGIEKNISVGMKYLRLAASAGVVDAQLRLAAMLQRGTQTAQQAKESYEEILRCAHHLVNHSRNRQDLVDAEDYFKIASD
jgi:TPR repeat protein